MQFEHILKSIQFSKFLKVLYKINFKIFKLNKNKSPANLQFTSGSD